MFVDRKNTPRRKQTKNIKNDGKLWADFAITFNSSKPLIQTAFLILQLAPDTAGPVLKECTPVREIAVFYVVQGGASGKHGQYDIQGESNSVSDTLECYTNSALPAFAYIRGQEITECEDGGRGEWFAQRRKHSGFARWIRAETHIRYVHRVQRLCFPYWVHRGKKKNKRFGVHVARLQREWAQNHKKAHHLS